RSGRWWRTCRGRPSPAAGATGSPASPPWSPSPVACRAERGRQRPAQRRVHVVVADVGVNRRRRVALVSYLLLDEPALHPVLGEVADVGMPCRMRGQGLREAEGVPVGDEAGVDLRRLDPAA